MKEKLSALLSSLMIIMSCCNTSEAEIIKWESEIIATEKAFCDMGLKDGLVKAFEHYAAEEGVLRRKNKIVKGKAAIAQWYKNDVRPNETLVWKPTHVDVSNSGDMAYTYGDFTFTYPDSLGIMKENKGIFHTVWKRQSNGEWKYVWD